MKKKVSIIGAGHVGATVALLLAQKDLVDIVMVDIAEGLAQGKALDLSQAAPILGYSSHINGTTSYDEIEDSSVVVVTAGLARKPGMTRLDLLKKNAAIIKEVTENIRRYALSSIIIVVTNPLDVMTYHALKISGFSRTRVFGQAGVLDGARFSHFIAQKLGVPVNDVNALVLGGHGDTMLPLVRHTKVRDKELTQLMEDETIAQLKERTQKGGAEIVSLLKTGSAYYAPAAATSYMVSAVLEDAKRVCPASVYLDGEYGLHDVCIGVPVKLGKEGVEEIITLDLSDREKASLHASAALYKESNKNLSTL